LKSELSGVITNLYVAANEKIDVGSNFVEIDTDGKPGEGAAQSAATPTPVAATSTPVATPTPVAAPVKTQSAPTQAPIATTNTVSANHNFTSGVKLNIIGSRAEKREPMSRMRQRISERLKGSQNTYATLTTFNEVLFNRL